MNPLESFRVDALNIDAGFYRLLFEIVSEDYYGTRLIHGIGIVRGASREASILNWQFVEPALAEKFRLKAVLQTCLIKIDIHQLSSR